jgi:hypothetical protein
VKSKDLSKMYTAIIGGDEKIFEAELGSKGYKNIVKYGISFCQKDCYIIKK